MLARQYHDLLIPEKKRSLSSDHLSQMKELLPLGHFTSKQSNEFRFKIFGEYFFKSSYLNAVECCLNEQHVYEGENQKYQNVELLERRYLRDINFLKFCFIMKRS